MNGDVAFNVYMHKFGAGSGGAATIVVDHTTVNSQEASGIPLTLIQQVERTEEVITARGSCPPSEIVIKAVGFGHSGRNWSGGVAQPLAGRGPVPPQKSLRNATAVLS
jgi:hypothetical protein